VLHTFHQILQKGFEGDNVINALADHFRNLLMCKDAATVNLLEVTESLREKYASQAKQTPLAFLLSALNILNDCDLHYRSSKNRRLHVEMCLIKLCYLNRVLLQPTQIVNIPNTDLDSKKKTEPNTIVDVQKPSVPTSQQATVAAPINTSITSEPASQYIPKTALKATGSSASDTSKVNIKGIDINKMQQQIPKPSVVEKPIEAINEVVPNAQHEIATPKLVEKKLYTPMEKFNAMLEKNPTLKDLATELKMEVDF
jgi:DNA polymerase III subunit gamma/tau